MSNKWLCILLAAVSGVVCAQPVVPAGAVVNAADYSRVIAPGAYITIFGTELAPKYAPATAVPLPATLEGTSVEVTDGARTELMPLWYVSPEQVAGQLPYDMGPEIQVRVVTGAGASEWDSLSLVARAPALYAVDWQGAGRAVLAHPDGELVTRQNPLKPGQWAVLYANSMGEVDPPVPAGQGANDGSDGSPLNEVTAATYVTIDERESQVAFAGLTPYLAGLYQVNLFSPYNDLIGDLFISLRVGEAESQANISVPAEPNGFYYLLSGGKFPNGQTKNAIPGPGSAVVFRHLTEEVWLDDGFEQWTFNSQLGPQFEATSGLALTLKDGGAIVYDNNGIEDGSCGDYYDNSSGAVPDGEKPGLYEWFSMSNNFDAIFATYFSLSEATTFDGIIGYFDGNGRAELRFDPGNVYNRFRVNIWSNAGGDMPATSSFTGDVLSSDTTAGTFEYSATDVRRVFSDGASDEIFRLVFTLEEPVTLPAGEYWFSHDMAVPAGESSPVILRTRKAVSSAVRVLPPGKTILGR